jgi:hypothetical protein
MNLGIIIDVDMFIYLFNKSKKTENFTL